MPLNTWIAVFFGFAIILYILRQEQQKVANMTSQVYLKKAEKLISENKYLMLSKSWCPDCHYTYAVWKKYNVEDKVHVIELDKMEQKEASELEKAFVQIAGRKWVPTIFFNGERFGTEETLKELERDGKLKETFREAGLL